MCQLLYISSVKYLHSRPELNGYVTEFLHLQKIQKKKKMFVKTLAGALQRYF